LLPRCYPYLPCGIGKLRRIGDLCSPRMESGRKRGRESFPTYEIGRDLPRRPRDDHHANVADDQGPKQGKCCCPGSVAASLPRDLVSKLHAHLCHRPPSSVE